MDETTRPELDRKRASTSTVSRCAGLPCRRKIVKTVLTCCYQMAILRLAMGGEKMVTRIQKWGNSQGLRLSKNLLEDACLSVGDDVNITINNGLIVIAPVRTVRGKLSLEELVSRIPKDYKPEEMDWGGPEGGESW